VKGLVVAAVLVVAAAAQADLYRWTAPDGTVHYASELDAIPRAGRLSAERVEHPQPRPAPPPEERGAAAVSVPWDGRAPVVVQAWLNGVALSLLLDTGADRTLISPDAIARTGLPVTDGVPVHLTGVTGTTLATLVVLPYLDVAGLRLGPLPVVIHPMPQPGVRGAEGLDGLLGRDLLEAFRITVDPGSGHTTLVPR
jgi:predicted aspartyl protease